MPSIKSKTIGGSTYHYLEHSYRVEGKVRKLQKYLGRDLPKDLDSLVVEFMKEADGERWYGTFDRIMEIYAKEQRRIPEIVAGKVAEDFAIRFTYNTNRIEGSTLTLGETTGLLKDGISPANRSLADVQEALAHWEVLAEALAHERDLSLRLILHWHRRLFERTKGDIAGRVRTYQVIITGSDHMPPPASKLEALLGEFFAWYRSARGELHPVELAALTHLKLVSIHPFGDGNGRLTRLVMNFVLHRLGYPMFIVPYRERKAYYHALERSQTTGEDRPFLLWMYRAYVKEHSRYAGER